MRSFGPTDVLKPVLAQGPVGTRHNDASEVRAWPIRLQSRSNLPLVLFFSVVVIFMEVGAGILWAEVRIQGGLFFGAVTVFFGVITVFIALVGVLIGFKLMKDRRAARVMRANAATPPVPGDQLLPDPGKERRAPPMRLDVYLQRELPPLPFPYAPQVTADRNIVGERPQRILYLYAFFSSASQRSQAKGVWRRFGPVYMLGSPQYISSLHSFELNIADDLSALLLTSCAAFDERLAAAKELPLPPSDIDLDGFAYISGGYPQHLFLCTDATWRHALTRLFGATEVVVIDATGYGPECAGLNWEIGCVVDHVWTEKFVVLMDGQTDQVALGEHFRQSWAAMRSDSPNNRADAAPVRFVLLEEAGTQINPNGLRRRRAAKLTALERVALEVAYLGHPTDDRIFGLLMEAHSVDTGSGGVESRPKGVTRA